MIASHNLKEKLSDLKGRPWLASDIVMVNNHKVRLGLFKGEYGWHKHDDADEFFLVCEGKITIQIKGQKDVVLRKTDFTMIPKGTEHNLISHEDSYVLVLEPIHMKTERVKKP